MKKRYLVLLVLGVIAIFLPLVGKIAPQVAQAAWDFHNGFIGIPRR